MMRKIFGVKSISHLIYGLLMLAPILAIGVKCGYVMLNKNAKDSYSGSNGIQYNDLSSLNQFTIGKSYLFNQQLGTYSDSSTKNSGRIFYSELSNINTTNDNLTNYLQQGNNFRWYYSNGPVAIYIFNDESQIYSLGITSNYPLSFEFKLEGYQSLDLENNYTFIKSIDLEDYYTLDNVFYYAIDEIIQGNNFGKINFTGWFDNMMLDNNVQINQTYTHLFNWYLNYTLFISCAYILWLVLMWFVNFARKLLDRGMNYDW